jgi:hypothetical protein
MEMEDEKLEELQEQLILIYKFISQHNKLKRFYYEGVEFNEPIKGDDATIHKLLELEDAEDVLQSCILELGEQKTGKNTGDEDVDSKVKFNEIMGSYDLNALFKKYGMKNLNDVGMLDMKRILSFL